MLFTHAQLYLNPTVNKFIVTPRALKTSRLGHHTKIKIYT